MSKYLWHSRGSAETAGVLARHLGLENSCGTIPPKDFKGIMICWGAVPNNRFKWETRDFKAIFNDPRVVRQFLDRMVLFETLAKTGLSTIRCLPFPKKINAGEYNETCARLGVSEKEGFWACKDNGKDPVTIRSQTNFVNATAASTRVVDPKINANCKVRIFVTCGAIVGALKLAEGIPNESFILRAAQEAQQGDQDYSVGLFSRILRKLISKNLVAPNKNYWSPHAVGSGTKRQVALAAAKALNLDFCAVDLGVGQDDTIFNVVTTPELVSTVDVAVPIANAIAAWVEKNTESTRTVLQEIIDDASTEEVSSFLEELRKIKGQRAKAQQG